MATALSQLYQTVKRLRGRRIFIVPTRFGFVYAAFLLLILLGAINYGNSLGHVLVFLLGSLGSVAMLHTYRNIAKIELQHAHANPVFLDQPINFILHFNNPTKHNSHQIEVTSKQVEIKSWRPYQQFMGFQHPHIIDSLCRKQITQTSYRLPSQHRGKQNLGRIRIASQFPLGLFRPWTYFKAPYTALVYPRPAGDLPLPNTSEQGQKSHTNPQKGLDDFSGFSAYRAGDPIHSIAWKALARDDVLRTKNFTSTHGGDLILSWQGVAQLKDVEGKLSQLCRWIVQAETAGISYSLSLPNITINTGRGDAHRHQCLSALALYDS